jgi:NAD-dependent SIR2 family protein deacetylase
MNPDAQVLTEFVKRAKHIAVVSGAGVSTGSGIPDYRDRNGEWKHAKPVQFAQFIGSPAVRQRYWARSFTGWSRIADAEPNAAHAALAALESAGRVDTLITQNVDGLHRRAGSRKVIDLHGRLERVRCLDCQQVTSREAWQQRLGEANRGWRGKAEFSMFPAVMTVAESSNPMLSSSAKTYLEGESHQPSKPPTVPMPFSWSAPP